MIQIVAKNILKAGKKDEFINLAQELIEKSRQEEGCISYNLLKNINDDSILTFIEQWKDQSAIDTHNKSEHFTRIVPLLGEFCEGKDINLYTEL